MSVHVFLLGVAMFINTAAVVVLCQPAGSWDAPHGRSSPYWYLHGVTSSVGADKLHVVLVLKAVSGENFCEIYGLAVFIEKPHFCWTGPTSEGTGRHSSSAGYCQVEIKGILSFSGWFQWKKEKILS